MHADELSPFDMSSPDSKAEAYRSLLQQVKALFADEHHWIANCAQFSAFIYQQLPRLNWAGFYLNHGDELVLGPFQGKVACVRIPFSKGVCGAAARSRQVQRVDDVHVFPGHIACDGASNAELVVPIMVGDRLVAVFDIDSPDKARFDEQDEAGIVALLSAFTELTHWPAKV